MAVGLPQIRASEVGLVLETLEDSFLLELVIMMVVLIFLIMGMSKVIKRILIANVRKNLVNIGDDDVTISIIKNKEPGTSKSLR